MTYNTKPPRQMPERDFWEAELAEAVYESMTGLRTDEARLDWVEDSFVSGHPCFEAYLQIRQALPDTDDDSLLDALLDYSRILATEMFLYGRISCRKE